jgi:tRNA nucleotidyltransferase (CCA-adding enzyme)
MHFLTAKLSPKDLAALKAMFVRPGFVEEWDNLDHAAREFNKQLSGKEAATPSATWKLFTTADPQAVLWLGLTSKSPAIQAKYKNFFTVWPEARQKVPHALFQELRITPEVPGYDEMMSGLFLGVIDGKLETDEQLRAFLEPYSPPAPPPPVTVRRTRGSKKSGEAKAKIPVEDAGFDGEPLDLDDEEAEAIEEVEVEDEEPESESEPEDSFPPVAKKSAPAPKKTLPASESGNGAKAQATPKPEAPAAKAAPAPTLHVVAPSKPAKVHVMAKAAAKPAAPVPAAKKALPIKAAAVKAVPAKAVPHKEVKKVPTKPAPPAKHAAPAKKAAPVKLHGKPQKKQEPAKKPPPPKKAAPPAKKHR